ncbi:hypothetical protein HYW46_00765 [Candidatus Daviesbacteria bacterium]|nr:hypothetical protein [Candidatus Daviesbacteria bacterium]
MLKQPDRPYWLPGASRDYEWASKQLTVYEGEEEKRARVSSLLRQIEETVEPWTTGFLDKAIQLEYDQKNSVAPLDAEVARRNGVTYPRPIPYEPGLLDKLFKRTGSEKVIEITPEDVTVHWIKTISELDTNFNLSYSTDPYKTVITLLRVNVFRRPGNDFSYGFTYKPNGKSVSLKTSEWDSKPPCKGTISTLSKRGVESGRLAPNDLSLEDLVKQVKPFIYRDLDIEIEWNSDLIYFQLNTLHQWRDEINHVPFPHSKFRPKIFRYNPSADLFIDSYPIGEVYRTQKIFQKMFFLNLLRVVFATLPDGP